MAARAARKKSAAESTHWRAHVTISVPRDIAEEIEQVDNRTVSNYRVQLHIKNCERSTS